MENVFIKGADISTLLEEIEAGAFYYDSKSGNPELEDYKTNPEELLTILKRYGFNSIRLRHWNDPYSSDGRKYGAGTNDEKSVMKLAKLCKKAGMSILYDVHYSDFWADPGKQTMPKAWKGLSVDELTEKVYQFTLKTMKTFKENGTIPEYVQVGNEVTNGLMWPFAKKPSAEDMEEVTGQNADSEERLVLGKKLKNIDPAIGNPYDNIARFISAGIRAVREVSPSTKIIIHLDNGGNNPMYRDWFDNYMARISNPKKDGVIKDCPMNQKDMRPCGPVEFIDAEDFDIIGLSYYPFWHGTMDELEFNLHDMAKRYGKPLVIAEVSTGFTMEDYRHYEGNPEELIGMATRPHLVEKVEYPMTKQGQCVFMLDFMNRVKSAPQGLGFYYWEPAWIPVPNVGWATKAALEYTGEKGLEGNEWANQALFDYEGRALPALKIIRDFN